MIEAVLILLAGFADRVRGGWPEGRPSWIGKVMRLYIGSVMASLLTSDWRLIVAAGPLLYVGFQIDNGWRGQWAQYGLGIRTFDLGMVGVALKWASLNPLPMIIAFTAVPYLFEVMPFLPYLFEPQPQFLLIWPAYWIGILVSMYLSTKLPRTEFLNLRHAHPHSELNEFWVILPLLLLGEYLCLLV